MTPTRPCISNRKSITPPPCNYDTPDNQYSNEAAEPTTNICVPEIESSQNPNFTPEKNSKSVFKICKYSADINIYTSESIVNASEQEAYNINIINSSIKLQENAPVTTDKKLNNNKRIDVNDKVSCKNLESDNVETSYK